MATSLDIDASRARIDATRRLCDAQRSRLAGLRRGERRHGDAAQLLALAEDALTIQMTIHKLLLRLERHPSMPPALPELLPGPGLPRPPSRASLPGAVGSGVG